MRGKFLISALFILTLVASLALAQPCALRSDYDQLVCGRSPDSVSGFGAVDICNNCFPCGVPDGVCPEDFYSTTTNRQGNCRLCPDPDCEATIEGYVFEQGYPVQNTEIITLYNTEDALGARVSLGKTNTDGYYIQTIPAGLHTVFTQFGTYQGPSKQVVMQRGEVTEVNFTINRGACNPDCTIGTTGVCSASCHGKEGCLFPANVTLGITGEYIANRCDGLEAAGSKVNLGVIDGETHRFSCCQGPYTSTTPIKPQITEGTATNKFSNSATWNIPVTYYNEPVTLKITILK
jgi:hypothetical protein